MSSSLIELDRRKGEIESSTVLECVEWYADQSGDSPVFLYSDGSVISYQELREFIYYFGGIMEACDLGHGHKVAIQHDNPQTLGALICAVSTYATAVPLDPELTEPEIRSYCELSDADVLIRGDTLPNIVGPDTIPGVPVFQIVGSEILGLELKTILAGQSKTGHVNKTLAKSDDIAFLMLTSGTTSESKVVAISHQRWMLRARLCANLLDQTAADRCINFMPLYHGGGATAGLVATLYSGSSIATTNVAELPNLAHIMDRIRPSMIVGSHTICASLADLVERADNCEPYRSKSLRMIRSGAGKIDGPTIDRLKTAFQAEVIEVYGSTETGFMARTPHINETQSTLPLLRHDGCQIVILDDSNKVTPTGTIGQIAVKGVCVISQYEQPSENDNKFFDCWYLTGDEGLLDEFGGLQVTGRLAETINRGGKKVRPTEIDEALLQHPAINQVVTFPIPHPSLGQEIGAAVVLADGAICDRVELSRFVRNYLTADKQPKEYRFVDEIPRSNRGKYRRRSLSDVFGIHIPTSTLIDIESSSPETEIQIQLAEIWSKILGVDQIRIDDNFFMLGGDSLKSIEVTLAIEEKLECRLPPFIMNETSTIRALEKSITVETFKGNLRAIRASGMQPPLYLIHGMTGDTICYSALSEYIETDQPIIGVCATRGAGDEQSISEMAARYVRAMRDHNPKGPYYIGGYSFGGLVAFEMAKQLEESGSAVPLLILFDPKVNYKSYDKSWMRRHLSAITSVNYREWPNYLFKRVRSNFDFAFKKVRQRETGKYEDFIAPHIRQWRKLLKAYDPPENHGRILYLKSSDELRDSLDDWRRVSRGDLEIVQVHGDHLSMMFDPLVQEMGKIVTNRLNEALNRPTDPPGSA